MASKVQSSKSIEEPSSFDTEEKITSLFEPVILIVMGLIVGFVAVALVSAMYGIFNQVKIQ